MHALAVLPFLPPGRGALILILGGLMVLPLSLLMARVGSRQPARKGRGAPMAFIPVPAPSQHGHSYVPPANAQPYSAFHPAPAPAVTHSPQPTHADGMAWQEVAQPQPVSRPWAGTGMERAIRQAVGWTQLLGAEPGHYVLRLGRCDSCLRRLPGCERERAAIARAVAPYLQNAHVTERACGQRDRRHAPCTFDVQGR
jgi:hypothetical protein